MSHWNCRDSCGWHSYGFYSCRICLVLPLKYVAYSHCFSTEAGAAGTATRGLYRVRQFSKVEMFILCRPEDGNLYHEELIQIEEELFSSLGLHFKTLDMASGDLGAPAYWKFDVEAWMPGLGRYGEGVPCPSVPRRNKPRRVDVCYSSCCIRAVESNRGDGQFTACEVMLFHHEEMGIPWEIAKLGIRQGMWGAVKKIEPGIRWSSDGQKLRSTTVALSRCAIMAQINTKIGSDDLRTLEVTSDSAKVKTLASPEKPCRTNIPKLIVIGGAVALASSLDRGLLTKAFIFGVARSFPKLGKRF